MKLKEIFDLLIFIIILLIILIGFISILFFGMDYIFSSMACAEQKASLESMGTVWPYTPVLCKKYENGEMKYFEINNEKGE